MSAFTDLTGQRFTKWKVLKRAANYKNGKARWVCLCDCGNESIVISQGLLNGRSRSCGCLQRIIASQSNTTHGCTVGRTQSREYRAWAAAKRRCFNPNARGYEDYGGRGITMCQEWEQNFEAFLNAMGACPVGHTLDRYPNNEGNYEKSNCRWATRKQQNRNTRRNHWITHDGITLTISEWAERTGLSQSVIYSRISRYHWSAEKTLATPLLTR